MPQYIYHNEKNKEYFGFFNQTENDIIYKIDYNAIEKNKKKMVNINATNI
jgi:hypothetical protein